MKRRKFLTDTLKGAAALGALALIGPAEAAVPSAPGPWRTVNKFDGFDWFDDVPWEELKKGDIFRLREADGTFVDSGTELELCTATSDAVFTEYGGYMTWKVACEPLGF